MKQLVNMKGGKMNKKILFALCLLLIPSVLAISEGQEFSQAQLDNQDINTIDLECQLDGTSHLFPFYAQWDASCLSIDEGTTSDYVVTREPLAIRKNLNFGIARDILRMGFPEYKAQVIEPFVRKRVGDFKDAIRSKAKDFQTVDYSQYDWDVTIE